MNLQLPLHHMPEDKRAPLIVAAISEFAATGYLAASTNRTVEAAGRQGVSW
jgi:hypothetical protein